MTDPQTDPQTDPTGAPSITMIRQVVVRSAGEVTIELVPTPIPAAGEALVRPIAVGICGSDVHASHARHPFVPLPYHPGHEIVGVVEGVGAGVSSELPVGSRVVIEPIHACGDCKYCLDGRYNLCATMRFFGCGTPVGGMSEKFTIRADRLVPVPDELEDLQAVLVEPLSTPVHAVALAGPDLTGRSVAILGAGTIGLLTLAAARRAGAERIVVADVLPAKRALAQRLGADAVFDSTDPTVVQQVREQLGTSADVVFDCVAVQSTVDQAIGMALKGGTVVIVGVPAAPVSVPLPEIQDRQVRIQGSATFTRADFATSIEMLLSGAVRHEDIVTARYPLAEAAAAFTEATSGSQVKVVLHP